MSVLTLPSTGTEIDLHVGGGNDFAGWFCIHVGPDFCGCGCEYSHVPKPVRILVWPDNDDGILGFAQLLLVEGYDPHVVPYERALGPAIPADDVT